MGSSPFHFQTSYCGQQKVALVFLCFGQCNRWDWKHCFHVVCPSVHACMLGPGGGIMLSCCDQLAADFEFEFYTLIVHLQNVTCCKLDFPHNVVFYQTAERGSLMQTVTVLITQRRLWYETMPTCLLRHLILMLPVLKLLLGYRGIIVLSLLVVFLLFSTDLF